ncbi:MAG: carbon-nitrogen hydrolase family protein [Clostridiaceae bacterium]|nr:carbon-nitrogen hydrolase family protein [Clostridiaceae bacterium]
MSNYRKISLLCSKPPTIRFEEGLERCITVMIDHLKKQLDKVLPDCPDLIVLPECCDRFPNFNPKQRNEYYKYRGNRIRDYLCGIAKEQRCYIAYSAVREVCGDKEFPFRNSIQLIGRNGEIEGVYDKNHCVIEENSIYQIGYGCEAKVIQLDFGRVACAICFDLNFDELLEQYISQKPDIILFSSAYHGGLRQERWAHACRAYFAGAVIADEGRVLSPLGQTIACTSNYYDFTTVSINLDYKVVHIDYNEEKIYQAKRKYGDGIIMHAPSHIGAVLLTCERDDMTIDDIIKEFKIELIDDYFNRARKHRSKYFEDRKDI